MSHSEVCSSATGRSNLKSKGPAGLTLPPCKCHTMYAVSIASAWRTARQPGRSSKDTEGVTIPAPHECRRSCCCVMSTARWLGHAARGGTLCYTTFDTTLRVTLRSAVARPGQACRPRVVSRQPGSQQSAHVSLGVGTSEHEPARSMRPHGGKHGTASRLHDRAWAHPVLHAMRAGAIELPVHVRKWRRR
jgi:hypothetical protein